MKRLMGLFLMLVAGLLLTLTSCMENGGTAEASDDESASFMAGKADAFGVTEGSAQAKGLLKLVNTADFDLLDESVDLGGVGLDVRAATNIVAYRVGKDNKLGTQDDVSFKTLTELDAVKYVGPVAFEKLLVYAEDNGYCDEFNKACVPVCDAIGSRSEGWYDGCTGQLIGWAKCDGCAAKCGAIGSKSEGWYAACGQGRNGSGLIQWTQCQDIENTCVSKPVCTETGTENEGWYDRCTGEQVRLMKCAGCKAQCGAIGSRSEGWYGLCPADSEYEVGLINWAGCKDVE